MKAAHWKKDSSMNGVLLKLISEGELRVIKNKKGDKRCEAWPEATPRFFRGEC